jgi:hypothetical protein
MRMWIAFLAVILGVASLPAAIQRDVATSPRAEGQQGKSSQAAIGKIIKVLPHYLDLQGRHSLSPSLYDRDAYQAFLRDNPQERSGLRFDVQWRSAAKSPLKLRIQIRGAKGKELTQAVLEGTVGQTGFSKWTAMPFSGDDYRKFGELAAWRATLWEGEKLLSEQKSFLW